MKTSQIVAGALIDFVNSMEDRVPYIHAVDFIREWAADRGFDLDQADVAGWQNEFQSHSIPPRMPVQVVRDL